jgi:hypothetical protein
MNIYTTNDSFQQFAAKHPLCLIHTQKKVERAFQELSNDVYVDPIRSKLSHQTTIDVEDLMLTTLQRRANEDTLRFLFGRRKR